MSKRTFENQPNLSIYNAYKRGLFGHHHSDGDIEGMGLGLNEYHKAQKDFAQFCAVIGGRVLYAMHEGSALVTPWPIDRQMAVHMSEVWGIRSETLTMVSFEQGQPVDDLPAMILADIGKMESLRRWSKSHLEVPMVMPRTTTIETLMLAKELGAGHMPKFPSIPVFANKGPVVRGYPSLEYMGKHPAEKNNSKVDNFRLLQELDSYMGTDFSPKGGVAESLEEVVRIADELMRQGCKVLIKADLAVDGMGNLRLDKFGDKEFRDLEHTEKMACVRELLAGKVPLGKSARVVVSEFLDTKIYDPSVEVYSPPSEWGVEPQIYYDCGMIVKGGFLGCIIGDPVEGADLSDIKTLEGYQIPGLLVERKTEYRKLMVEAKRMVLEFSKVKWGEGYVGISDCDLAICLGSDGQLFVKILEFNFNRETGGTAPYHIGQRLGVGRGAGGYVVARDGIGAGIGNDFSSLQQWSEDNGLDYMRDREGLLVLGSRLDGGIMSLVYAPTLKRALEWDLLLKRLAEK